MIRQTLFTALLLACTGLVACATPPPETLAGVRISEGDLPNSFTTMNMPLEIAEAFEDATTNLYDREPATTYAYENRNGRSRVFGFSVEAPTEADLQTLVESVNMGLAPDALASGAEDLPPVQMEILGDLSYGSTFTVPRTEPEEEYIMRVNTIALQRGPNLALVIVTFEDRTAAPVDVYSMARRLDSRLIQFTEPGEDE